MTRPPPRSPLFPYPTLFRSAFPPPHPPPPPPLHPDPPRRLRQLGLTTLGRLAALPQEAVVSQFGAAGRRMGRLAAGGGGRGVRGPRRPRPVAAAPRVFSSPAHPRLLAHAALRACQPAVHPPRRL